MKTSDKAEILKNFNANFIPEIDELLEETVDEYLGINIDEDEIYEDEDYED